MLDLCILGTGGTMPMPDRALSSLYVRVNGRALIIDCGEGTQVGVQRLGWGMQCIDGLLITHYHADHCSGLPGMLLALTKAMRTEPLHIWGPTGLQQVVTGLRVIAPQLSFPIVLHELGGGMEPFSLIGLTVTPFPVDHGMPCIGYHLHLPRQAAFDPAKARSLGIPLPLWKRLQQGESVEAGGTLFHPHQVTGAPRTGISLLYATDTRPLPVIAALGRDTDLMILEGMYGSDDKLPLAIRNHHMLFSEAAALARDAGTKQLLLTHYSTSLDEPEAALPAAQAIFPCTQCAADGMTLTLRFPS